MLRIVIGTGNDAFGPDPSHEIARLLKELADSIEASGLVCESSISLRDINGNKVGYASFKED